MINTNYTTHQPKNRRLEHVTGRIYEPAGPGLRALIQGGSRYMFGNAFYVVHMAATEYSPAFVAVMRVGAVGRARCVYSISLFPGRVAVNKGLYERATRYARLRAQGFNHTEAIYAVHRKGKSAWHFYGRVTASLWATINALMHSTPQVAHKALKEMRENGYEAPWLD